VCRRICTPGGHTRFASRTKQKALDGPPALLVAQNAPTSLMPALAERLRQALRQGHMTNPSALRTNSVTLPLRPANAQTPLSRVHIAPFQRHDFPTTEPRLGDLSYLAVLLGGEARSSREAIFRIQVV
jgi:hypothetical protein